MAERIKPPKCLAEKTEHDIQQQRANTEKEHSDKYKKFFLT